MMILTSPVSCAYDSSSYYCACSFYICCHLTKQIRSMMSMTNLVLTSDPLVRTIFALFVYILTSPLLVLVFWGLFFCIHRSRVQR